MPSSIDSPRIVIVGATTLRGKELVDLLKERIPSADLKLLDEEIAAGILTEAAGEPAWQPYGTNRSYMAFKDAPVPSDPG